MQDHSADAVTHIDFQHMQDQIKQYESKNNINSEENNGTCFSGEYQEYRINTQNGIKNRLLNSERVTPLNSSSLSTEHNFTNSKLKRLKRNPVIFLFDPTAVSSIKDPIILPHQKNL